MSDNFITYSLVGKNPTFYFSGYFNEEGDEVFIKEGIDKDGMVIRKRFFFVDGSCKVHKNKKEVVDFFDNSPFCQGSKNLKGNPIFLKIDIKKDVGEKVKERGDAITAEYKALNLEGDMLRKVALLCGCSDKEEVLMRQAVLGYAGKNPAAFMELIDEDNTINLEYQSFLKECVARGTVKLKGTVYMFEAIPLGTTEREATETLYKDKELYAAIKSVHEKLAGGSTNTKEDKKNKKANLV